MLPPWTMLREKECPRIPRAGHNHTALAGGGWTGVDVSGWRHAADGVLALRDDPGVCLVECDAQCPGCPVSGEAAVAEVHPKEVCVCLRRQCRHFGWRVISDALFVTNPRPGIGR